MVGLANQKSLAGVIVLRPCVLPEDDPDECALRYTRQANGAYVFESWLEEGEAMPASHVAGNHDDSGGIFDPKVRVSKL